MRRRVLTEVKRTRETPWRLAADGRTYRGGRTKETVFPLERFRTGETGVHVGRWENDADGRYGLPKGAYSWGVWFEDTPMTAYRIHEPNGALVSYRFDCLVEPPTYDPSRHTVAFDDLLLDAFVYVGDDDDGEAHYRVVYEDEEDVNESELSEKDMNTVRSFRRQLDRDVASVVRRVDGALRTARPFDETNL